MRWASLPAGSVSEQLWGGIGAVFGSWMNPRAITYRELHDIPARWGTAVNVQAMVFGNMGDDSRHRRRLHPQSVHRRETRSTASI
jgi:phosphoenolpyruvate synthase/pyruvate phosphate dikinase